VMSSVMSAVMSAPRKKRFCSYLLLFFFVIVLFMLLVLIYWCSNMTWICTLFATKTMNTIDSLQV
jgi:uncharacterized membrane protein